MVDPATARECLLPWRLDVIRATTEYDVDPFRFAGLLLRESGAGFGPAYKIPPGQPRHLGYGDHGHGHGLVQFDDRYHAEVIHSAAFQTPIGQFRAACNLLRENWRGFLQAHAFGGSGEDAWRCAFAAYNAGFGNVLHAYVVDGIDAIDRPTTGHDYSKDVFQRAEVLRSEWPALFTPQPQEIA